MAQEAAACGMASQDSRNGFGLDLHGAVTLR
jgi:hypothetical protein